MVTDVVFRVTETRVAVLKTLSEFRKVLLRIIQLLIQIKIYIKLIFGVSSCEYREQESFDLRFTRELVFIICVSQLILH